MYYDILYDILIIIPTGTISINADETYIIFYSSFNVTIILLIKYMILL